jgi:hypothetical protein
MHQLMFLRFKAWGSDKIQTKIGRDDFTQITFPMNHQQSSRSEDEPLCLGLLAGVPVSLLLQFPPDCRMEQIFGNFKTVPNSIFSDKPRIYKPARKWMPASLLNTSNFYGGPDGQPTPEGLLVRFFGILLESLGENKLFPCRYTAPDGLFYLRHNETAFLCKYKPRHYCIIPKDGRSSSFGHEPAFGIGLHSEGQLSKLAGLKIQL